jgi:hypothetical protein
MPRKEKEALWALRNFGRSAVDSAGSGKFDRFYADGSVENQCGYLVRLSRLCSECDQVL